MIAIYNNNIYDGESTLLDALKSVENKINIIGAKTLNNMADNDFTKIIREYYGPPMNYKHQKEYWKDKVYISYVDIDFVDPSMVVL